MGDVFSAFILELTSEVTFSVWFNRKNFSTNSGRVFPFDGTIPTIGDWLVVYCHWWPDGSTTIHLSTRSHNVDVGRSCTFSVAGRNRRKFQVERDLPMYNTVSHRNANFENGFRIRFPESSPFTVDFVLSFRPNLCKFSNASGSIIVIGPRFDVVVGLENYLDLLKGRLRIPRAIPIPVIALVVSIIGILVSISGIVVNALTRFTPIENVVLVWVDSIHRFVVYKHERFDIRSVRTVSVEQVKALLAGPTNAEKFSREYGWKVYSPFFTALVWDEMAKDSVFGSTYST
uniref:33 kDa protein n=1 Tax=Tobacco rattle virus TaxID=12295 RepID=Q9QBL0_9VIRU|nr:33 kDa protein [Tobacco rattle virus]